MMSFSVKEYFLYGAHACVVADISSYVHDIIPANAELQNKYMYT